MPPYPPDPNTRGVSALAQYLEPFARDRATEIAKAILQSFGSLDRALQATPAQLGQALGEKNRDVASLLQASHRLILAALSENVQRTKVRVGDQAFTQYLLVKFRGLAFEELHAIFLDHEGGFIREDLVAIGNAHSVETRLACLFRRAIEVGAQGMLLMHNHPSSKPYPSVEDIRATRQIVQVASALDLCVEDHLIIAGNIVVSMKNEGFL